MVSVLSAFFAGLAWWQSRRQAIASAEMVDIERGRVERQAIEAQSARVTIGVDRGSIKLQNIGQSVARSVNFVPDIRIGDSGSMPHFDLSMFPCDLQPGHEIRVHFVEVAASVGRLQVGLSWVDERGRQQEFMLLALT